MKNTIIIIGGMGPQASVELHRLVVSKAGRAITRPEQFPEILHVSVTVKDFIADSMAVPDVVRHLRSVCAALPMDSSAAIGLACNTAHLLIDMIPELRNDRFVSMIEAVCDSVCASKIQTVGLLASPSTIRSKLYETSLRDRGVDVVVPHEDDLSQLTDIIRGVITGQDKVGLRVRLSAIAKTLQEGGADVILLGCTELPIVGVDTELPTISSLDVLATQLLAKHSERAML